MMCNDVPKIQPLEQAVTDRIGGVFDMQVKFLEKPDPSKPHLEKLRDPYLKAKLEKPEYQNAFVSILLDAYQFFKHNVVEVPASVTQAIADWVTDGASLESLLGEAYETHLVDGKLVESKEYYVSGRRFVSSEEIYHTLVIEGVGLCRKKLAMSATKLGKELSKLGYVSDMQRINGRHMRVRLGLSERTSLVVEDQDGF